MSNETILICDDDHLVLTVMELSLAGHGYQLLVADSPEKALALAKETVGGINLLITDVVMPNMNGPVLAKEVRELHHGIKTLFVSGYDMDTVAEEQGPDDIFKLLVKPFSRDMLLESVQSMLR